MKSIILTQGKVAIVSNKDFALLSKHKWYAIKRPNGCYYALTNVKDDSGRYTQIRMHRFILGAPKGSKVDHKDHDGLNNTRRNIRQCTHVQNLRNQRTRVHSSKYKGVSWNKHKGMWRACIYPDKRGVDLGFFENEVGAAKAYDKAAKKHFGKFACLNFEVA